MKKIAFITGANKGIGLETAKQLGKLGLYPVIGARDLKKGQDATTSLLAQGIECEAIEFDVTDRASHKKAYDFFEKTFGHIDVLVNNAGIFLNSEGGASTEPEKNLRDTLETNFLSQVFVTQTLLPLLKKAPEARIVNVSSILGSLTKNSEGGTANFSYDVSKTALNSFTVHLAQELAGTKIKVNSIHPGWVQTDMGGAGATLSIEEGAKTSVRLATLDSNGPSGGYFHMNDRLPW
jgi:NAD(P)-dependent dehydrogenase (short-subunit alcohol dehydrogenase family)